jgi:hypothetical protein
MRKLLIACGVLAAGVAAAEVGSIIGSFQMNAFSGTYRWCFGADRDETFVYAVDYDIFTGDDYLIARDTSGNLARLVPISGVGGWWKSYGDRSHLGAGYMAVADFGDMLTINKTSGSIVSSFRAAQGDSFFWDGSYYYCSRHGYAGVFDRFTSTGSAAGAWTASGWPAAMTGISGCGYSSYACGAGGRYLVATAQLSSEPSCIIDINTGSLLATWALNYIEGAVCGPAHPRSYGESYWVIKIIVDSFYAVQVDINGRHVGVVPASVGKIKALYR